MSIPHNLKIIRGKWRLSQESFAQMMDGTRSIISNYEMGQSLPSLEFMLRLSNLTGIPVDFLFYKQLREEDLPEQFLQAEEPRELYQRRNLYDVRDLVREVEELRKEIEELKKKG